MSGLALLQSALQSALANSRADDEGRSKGWLDDEKRGLGRVPRGGGGGGGRRRARRRPTIDGGAPPGSGGGHDLSPNIPPSSSRIAGLSKGSQSAVIKVVSFASGGTRVGALAAYVTKEREGGVVTEDEDAIALDRAAVLAKLDRWKQGYSDRKPTKDVATIRFDIMASPDRDQASVQGAVSAGFDGHHHAVRVVAKGAGAFEVTAVVAAEGRSWKGDDDKTKRQARYKFDEKFETFIAGRVAAATGGRVEATVTGTSHGRDGVAYRLGRLSAAGAARDEEGREISSEAHVRERANAWKRDLGSRAARDVMHLVVSAKAGTDAAAFRETAREFFASEFKDREYLFAVHNDRGHLHAHAMVQVQDARGHRLNPNIGTFSAWRTRYAEVAQAHGIDMVATKRSDLAAVPAFKQGEAALVARGMAPDHIRRKVDAKRAGAIHVPVRQEGRQRAREAYQAWKAVENGSNGPAVDERVNDQLTRLSAAVNLSHSRPGLELATLTIIERGASMARATADYLTAEFNRANQVLNRALPMLQGSDKVQATKLAGDYLASLAKQVEAVQAVEAGQFVERAHTIHVREERQAEDASEKARVLRETANEAERNLRDTPPGDSRSSDAVALEVAAVQAERTASQERVQANALSREEQAFRTNPAAPVPNQADLPADGKALRDEQELLIDRIETQRMSHTKAHRQ